MVMRTVTTLEDFIRFNLKDLERILVKTNKNIFVNYEKEDVIQSVLLHFHRNDVITKWNSNQVDGCSFSTWIFKVISNYVRAYYVKMNQEQIGFKRCLSLDTPLESEGNTSSETISYYLEDQTDYYSKSDFSLNFQEVLKQIKRYDTHDSKRKITYCDLLTKYLSGYADAEIAKHYGCTIAGIGQQKKKLRELIERCEDGTILSKIRLNESSKHRRKISKEKSNIDHSPVIMS